MKSDEFNRVDQAVYGYSNGHRELASSVPFSAIDTYELAAASDLAPGVKLEPDQSYITGLMLPESRKYALIRTWLAPEMPRPGCVWSHVLILDRHVLSTQADLTVLKLLFKRPARYQDDPSLSISLSLNRRAKGKSARRDVIEHVLSSCYAFTKLSPEIGSEEDRENAILAVWSQQWPRLRASFVFRSVPSSTDLKGQFFHFHSTGSQPSNTAKPEEWINEAAIDATSETITPLRRFLWRYGKDIDASRRSFPFLVNAFVETRGTKLEPHVASNTFIQFKSGQADTLKRDLLGIANPKLSLVPALSTVDVIQLAAKLKLDTLGSTEDEIASLFTKAQPADLPEIVRALDTVGDKLGSLGARLGSTLIQLADERCLVDPAMPQWFVFETLSARPELVSEATASGLSQNELLDLAQSDVPQEKLEVILRLLVRGSYTSEAFDVLENFGETMFLLALELYRLSKLDRSWTDAFRSEPIRFVPFIESVNNGEALASAADLLGYPITRDTDINRWHSRLRKTWATASNDSQSSMLVFVFVLCVNGGMENNRQVIRDILPELRKRILANKLPSRANNMLNRWLPEHRDYWDLHRRLLKLFRREYKRGINLDDILEVIDITDDDYAYATNQNPENLVRSAFRLFMPWVSWD